jgi:hypothetical protein
MLIWGWKDTRIWIDLTLFSMPASFVPLLMFKSLVGVNLFHY